MRDLAARYRAWPRLPVTPSFGGGVLAFFAGLTALLMVGGGLVGGVLMDAYPRHGRLVGWRWPVLPLVVLVFLLVQGLRHRPPAPAAADAGQPAGVAAGTTTDEPGRPPRAPRST